MKDKGRESSLIYGSMMCWEWVKCIENNDDNNWLEETEWKRKLKGEDNRESEKKDLVFIGPNLNNRKIHQKNQTH